MITRSKSKNYHMWHAPISSDPSFLSPDEALRHLHSNYENPKSPISFRGKSSIYNYYRRKLPLKTIANFLNTQTQSIKFARSTKKKYNPSFVRFKAQQFQWDLVDVTK